MILVALDGRSAAGKSTLADALARDTGALVFHMDDYFLPRDLHKPGIAGNMDLTRFRQEVLEPLRAGITVTTRRFDCSAQRPGPEETLEPADLVIVEGAYSLHPLLRDFYDFRVFLDIDPETQKARLLQRGGPDKTRQFEEIWIPREEAYLQTCGIRELCDMILEA